MYQSGMTVLQVALALGHAATPIYLVLKRVGVQLRKNPRGRKAISAKTLRQLKSLYIAGLSIPELAERFSYMSRSTIRQRLLSSGVTLRTRTEGIRLAAPKMSKSRSGIKKKPFSEQHRANISKAQKLRPSRGYTHKQNGYIAYTQGPNKDRSEHGCYL
jgi:hypothetical protein